MVKKPKKKIEYEKENAGDIKPENRSIGSLKLDLALLEYISARQMAHAGPVRMREIMESQKFSLLSETSVRKHLKHLVVCGCLYETNFRGSYEVSEPGYDDFIDALARRYLKRILGDEFAPVMDRLVRLYPRKPS